ncbi:hypothetical protein ACIHFE_20300 [Streptomyces sp. NPDC052396]|uniref:hypothetical protein n=1 Tax=Streptomyces sp. NPDC052396 TaxID=3365689 RepID=UPI0037D1A60F
MAMPVAMPVAVAVAVLVVVTVPVPVPVRMVVTAAVPAALLPHQNPLGNRPGIHGSEAHIQGIGKGCNGDGFR